MHCVRLGCGMLQVCAVTRGGAFAEEVCVNEGAVLKVPPGVDLVSAAGVLLMLKAWCQSFPRPAIWQLLSFHVTLLLAVILYAQGIGL